MDKEALTQAVDSALNYDYTFFDDAISRLVNQELLSKLDTQIHLVHSGIYNYDDLVLRKDDPFITDPYKDKLLIYKDEEEI